MEVAKILVTDVCTRVLKSKKITSGMIGATVSFVFDDTWDGLTKTVVYRCGGVTRDETIDGTVGTIPAEVLAKSGWDLMVGVYGTCADDTEAIPTLWANLGRVHSGADPSGDPAADPSLPIWAQILAKLGNLADLNTEAKENLVAAINEALTKGGGEVDPEEIERIVNEYLEKNPPAAYTLPIATETTLGGVKAAAATEDMTQPVGITEDGKLVTAPGQNSGGNVDLTGVVKSVNGVTPDESGNVEIAVSGGSGGMSTTAVNLLIDILSVGMFTTNVSGKIESLKEALLAGSSGDSGSGDDSGEDSGGDDNSGGGETVTDDITVFDGIMTIVSVGSAITVSDGIMSIA